jgi:hypothetical protein
MASAAATSDSSTMQPMMAIMLVRWVALASAILPSICPAMWVPSAFIAANRSRRAGRDCSSEICCASAITGGHGVAHRLVGGEVAIQLRAGGAIQFTLLVQRRQRRVRGQSSCTALAVSSMRLL